MILIKMLESLSPSKAAVRESLDALLKYLQEELREKKYLLVLDDVWNEDSEKWNELMNCLLKLESGRGSNIIVTTRSAKVASISEKQHPRQKLGGLSVDECWSILKDKAFSKTSDSETFETIGREIAEKCAGVPLTAKVLGGILRSKKSISEWSSVKDSKIWDLPTGDDKIFSILRLSFDNLESPALKQCFAYCSVFMKDVTMKRDDLIQLWMAQGLLHSSREQSKEMEDIGNEYFDILFQSSLFQDATVDDDGIVTECKMHDLVHDLAERVSESGSMMRDFHEIQDVATPIIERIPEGSSGKLRSLFSNAEALPGNMLPWFKALRVLNLYLANIEELPSSIGKLKHLRYLNISGTGIKRLPNSIGKLYNLQTLRTTTSIRATKRGRLNNLLQTLRLTKRGLVEFPKNVQNLINLRHVYWHKRTKFPVGVLGKLTSLRTLSPFYVDKAMGCGIEELAALNQLKGELIIYNLERVSNGDEARKAKLDEKKNIHHLEFVWSITTWNNNAEDVLEGLQPHLKLEELVIKYFMGAKFPSSLRIDNLKRITFEGCKKCEKVPTLGHLPHLTHVWIDEMDNLKCVGEEIYGNDVFPALKELHISNCTKLIEWMDAPKQVMVFPCLKKLKIENCPQLKKVPDVSGCCASLREFVVYRCHTLEYIPDLRSFTCLRVLSIQYCERLESLVSSGPVSVVELLTIELCGGLQSIPSLNLFTSLRELRIEICERLDSLVSSGPITVVELLTIIGCGGLQSIPALNLFTALRELWIENCERLESLVSSGPVSVVELLTILYCHGLQSIPALNLFTSLRELRIEICKRLESSVSSGLQLPTSLVELEIVYYGKLKYLPPGLHCCSSLKNLRLGGFWEELDSFPDFHLLGTGSSQLQKLELIGWPKLKSLPHQIQHFTSLTCLEMHWFDGVESLEDWLGNFTSLTTLWIWSCKKLMYLPSVRAMQRLTKLKTLRIWGCPLLQERCIKDSGPELPKISHIPRTKIG